MPGREEIYGVRVSMDCKMLLQSLHRGVTIVGNPVLALFAVMDEQYSRIQVDIIQSQSANLADSQPAVS